MSERRQIEVAVIGGGCAAVAAAFELTRPEHQRKYHVTLYQVGWRLGGKGASGRGPAGRIEEHGLHLWMGFYENAFRLLRECYAELKRDPRTCRFADWRDAFRPEPFIGVTERSASGAWRNWMAYFPPGEGLPGDPLTGHNPFSISNYMVRTATLLRSLLTAFGDRSSSRAAQHGGARGNAGGSFAQAAGGGESSEEVLAGIGRLLKYGMLATTAGLIEAAGLLEMVFRAFASYSDGVVLRLLEAIASNARRQFEALIEGDDDMRRLWEIIDMLLALQIGTVRFGLLTDPRGYDAINDYDTREWLKLNGASERSVNSALMRGLYDLALAYEDGDSTRPRMAAGLGLRGCLRMFFTYRGAMFWKMQAGMGDVVFAPFYEVLKRRGVSFRFFHRLENVRLADPARLAPGERPYVEALEFDLQAEIKGGREYQPLVDVSGVPCWPSQPDYSQLAGGARLEREGWEFESWWDWRRAGARTLRVVEDFDFVVLGVGLGVIPHVCKEIVARDRRWRDMVERVKTVATQAFQVWLREDMQTLGWHDPPATMSGFTQPFDTWADMSQLITAESWPAKPRAIAYFCSVLPDPAAAPERSDCGYPTRRRDEVRRNAVRFLNNDVVQLWPGAARSPGEFRWELLAAPARQRARRPAGKSAGESRFASQFWIANVNPSDRYVLSVPGSAKYRISPLDNTYDNLTVAGDWTSCGLNEGCVEAAVTSGRLAAHAITSLPRLEEIVGYDHP